MDATDIANYLSRRVSATCSPLAATTATATNYQVACVLALFEAAWPPASPIGLYAQRLLNGLGLTEGGASVEGTLACILLQRLELNLRQLTRRWDVRFVTASNAHRLYLAALLVSVKFLHDSEDKWLLRAASAVGGVEPRELVQLEAAFLMACAFSIVVGPSEYRAFCAMNQPGPRRLSL
eukprot:TRINITY_DN18856_c0_g1_i1.p1 TRINITY_DN18856_c0_g1~~TRINITY_DN18856_c0_g1_i1.p1  ORF type:complete len:180 (+),score=59.58 TRINITY_DN18856_c0_g1_i1:46-585(+)